MKNTIEINNVTTKQSEIHLLCNEEEKQFLNAVLYMYSSNTSELHGSLSMVENVDFASIETLNLEIEEQRLTQKYQYLDGDEAYEFVDFKPKGLGKDYDNFLVCQEGVFEWDWEKEIYEFLGTVQQTVRIRSEIKAHNEIVEENKDTGFQDYAIIKFSKVS